MPTDVAVREVFEGSPDWWVRETRVTPDVTVAVVPSAADRTVRVAPAGVVPDRMVKVGRGNLFGFLPTQIGGVVGWYAADQMPLADGQAVGSWTDLSVHAYHVVQATSSLRPTFHRGALNGLPVLRFGGSHWLRVTYPNAFNQPIHRFMVGRLRVAPAGNQTPLGGVNAAHNLSAIAANQRWRMNAGANIDGQPVSTAWAVLTTLGAGAASHIRVNGTQNSGNAGTGNLGGTTVGGSNAGSPANLFDGDIAEVIVYAKSLSEAELYAVERYLGDKYDIPVAA